MCHIYNLLHVNLISMCKVVFLFVKYAIFVIKCIFGLTYMLKYMTYFHKKGAKFQKLVLYLSKYFRHLALVYRSSVKSSKSDSRSGDDLYFCFLALRSKIHFFSNAFHFHYNSLTSKAIVGRLLFI